jgi:predicted phage tail protein
VPKIWISPKLNQPQMLEGGLMRTLLAALLIAGGVGLAGASAVSAAPTSGLLLGEGSNLTGGIAQQAHWRYRSRWRWHHRGGRCHRRYRSWWHWC